MKWLGLAATLIIVTEAHAQGPVRVSAGDTTSTATTIWAQFQVPGEASIEFSRQSNFATIEKRVIRFFETTTEPKRTRVTGFTPGQRYYYRCINADGQSASGQFKTFPLPGTSAPLRFGVSGDGATTLSPFPVLKDIPSRDLDFFAYIGDTVYADASPAATTLAQYRAKHEGVLAPRFGPNFLTVARAATNWFVTLDDHEVVNDFAGGSTSGDDLYNRSQRYQDALQSFFEYNPIETTGWPYAVEPRFFATPRLYRRLDHGRTATFILTDCRSFRDNTISGSTASAFLNASFDPNRTHLGETQLQRLLADLRDAQSKGIVWKFVTVSVPIQNLGTNAGAADKWDGFLHERTRLLKAIHTEGIRNVVFVSADIHGGLVNDLSYSEFAGGPQTRTGAWDIATGPVAFYNTYGPNLQSTAVSGNWTGVVSNTIYNGYSSEQKETYIRDLLRLNRLQPRGYDPIGLNNSLVPATLEIGSYSTTHSYTWSEFEIPADASTLRVRTWGIPAYSSSQITADPAGIVGRTPQVIQQFVVNAVNP